MNPSDPRDHALCDAMRAKILERDAHRCRRCGSETGLVVHHIRYRVPCRSRNLVTLCSSCHNQLHSLFPELAHAPKFKSWLHEQPRGDKMPERAKLGYTAVRFTLPTPLLEEFDEVTVAAGYNRSEALRTAMRDLIVKIKRRAKR